MDLRSQTLLNSSVLLSHDISPDAIERIKDLTDACLGHVAIELVTDLEDSPDGLRRDPIIVLGFFRTASITASSLSRFMTHRLGRLSGLH